MLRDPSDGHARGCIDVEITDWAGYSRNKGLASCAFASGPDAMENAWEKASGSIGVATSKAVEEEPSLVLQKSGRLGGATAGGVVRAPPPSGSPPPPPRTLKRVRSAASDSSDWLAGTAKLQKGAVPAKAAKIEPPPVAKGKAKSHLSAMAQAGRSKAKSIAHASGGTGALVIGKNKRGSETLRRKGKHSSTFSRS